MANQRVPAFLSSSYSLFDSALKLRTICSTLMRVALLSLDCQKEGRRLAIFYKELSRRTKQMLFTRP